MYFFINIIGYIIYCIRIHTCKKFIFKNIYFYINKNMFGYIHTHTRIYILQDKEVIFLNYSIQTIWVCCYYQIIKCN